MVRSHGSCIHTYYHHAELLDAPYTIILFWFILLLTETLILPIVHVRCVYGYVGVCVYVRMCMYVCMYVCMCVCVRACAHVCMHRESLVQQSI